MKNKILLSVFLIISFSVNGFSWGDKGHKLIMQKALEILPAELNFLNNWKDYLSEQVLDADIRKKDDKSEEPNHYIDMDFYEEFLKGNMILDKDSMINKYGEEKVTKIGLLPWATMTSYEKLINAFEEKDRDKILFYIGDLGHYTGDGHQPLHTVLNYDGKLSGQKGVHFRYEISMIDKYFQELSTSLHPARPELVNDPEGYIFSYISDSNFKNDIILASDKIASANADPESEDYYRILWFRTKNVTIEQIDLAATSVAALIYTAWDKAGRPSQDEIK